MGFEGRALQSLSRTSRSRSCVQDVMRSHSNLVPAGHRSPTANWLAPPLPYPAAVSTETLLVQRNSSPSAHMRCITTESFRATATVARRRPRRLATLIAQAFSADHRVTRVSNACAARNSASRRMGAYHLEDLGEDKRLLAFLLFNEDGDLSERGHRKAQAWNAIAVRTLLHGRPV